MVLYFILIFARSQILYQTDFMPRDIRLALLICCVQHAILSSYETKGFEVFCWI